MTNEKIVKSICDFMGWKFKNVFGPVGEDKEGYIRDPLRDANSWMLVIKKMQELDYECRLEICKELIRVGFYKTSMYAKKAEPAGYSCVSIEEGEGCAVCMAVIKTIEELKNEKGKSKSI